MGVAGSLVENPRPHLPGRVVADMLGVTAGEIGDPVMVFVLMEGDDGLSHEIF